MRPFSLLFLSLLSAGIQAQLRIQVVGLQPGHRLEEVAVSINKGGKWTTIGTSVEGNALVVNSAALDSVQLSFVGYENVLVAVQGRQQLTLEMRADLKRLKQVRVCGRQGRYAPKVKREMPSFPPSIQSHLVTFSIEMPTTLCRMANLEIKMKNLQPEDTLQLVVWDSWAGFTNRQRLLDRKFYGLTQEKPGFVRLPMDTLWLDQPDTLLVALRLTSPRKDEGKSPHFYLDLRTKHLDIFDDGNYWTLFDNPVAYKKKLADGMKLVCRFDYWD